MTLVCFCSEDVTSMQNENMQTVGAYLKKNRELRGISLEEIASSTKININILSYLEADRFEKLPAPVFVKGFIKTYLGYLGVDPKEAVLFYDLITDGHKQADTKINTLTEKDVCEPKERINKRVLVGAVSISVIFASLLTYYLATNKPSDRSKNKMIVKMLPGGQQIPLQPQGITLTPAANEPGKAQQPVVVAPAPVAPAPVTTTTVAVTPAPAPVPVAPAPKPAPLVVVTPTPVAIAIAPVPAPTVAPATAPAAAQIQQPVLQGQQVTIKAGKDAWLKVKLDDSDSFDFLLRAGSTRKLEARTEIKVLIGDASAVTVIYRGETISNLGKEGNTRTLVFPGLGRWKDAMQ